MFRQPTIVVVRQLGGIGDVLALSCVFRGFREKYPKHKIICITSKAYLSGSIVELAQHNPFIDEIVVIEPWDETTAVTKGWWKQFEKSKALEDNLIWQRADVKVDLNVACIQREKEEFDKHKMVITPRYKIWCDAANVVPSTYAPVYEITKKELQQAKVYYKLNFPQDKPLVAVGLAAHDPKRGVSFPFLSEICQILTKQGCHIVTIDATRKLPEYQAVVGMRIQELIPLISQMKVMVTVDSGLLHIAGTVGTPLVGIFGPTDYAMRMGLYTGSSVDSRRLVDCSPCWYSYPCLREPDHRTHMRCMNNLTPSLIANETLRWVNTETYQNPTRLELTML